MFYAYILKSVKDSGYYYGSTSNLDNRLKTHNAGKVRSTKGRRPWKLHYIEKYESRSEAVEREMFFKTIDGYNWLKSQKITEDWETWVLQKGLLRRNPTLSARYTRRIRLIGKSAVLKTAAGNRLGVRVPHPPQTPGTVIVSGFLFYNIIRFDKSIYSKQ